MRLNTMVHRNSLPCGYQPIAEEAFYANASNGNPTLVIGYFTIFLDVQVYIQNLFHVFQYSGFRVYINYMR